MLLNVVYVNIYSAISFNDCFITVCKHVYMYVDISMSTVQQFIDECIMTSKLDHPNVLCLIGVSINPNDATLHMIMPFMHNGDVKSFLKSKRGNMIEFDHYPKVPIAIYVCMYSSFTVRTLVMYIICIYVMDLDL